MPKSNPYDLIIVGSGPAGISTALHLAQVAPELAGRTLILEKAHHPRPKLCGGGLLPDAEVVLRGLGLDVTELPHVDVDWARFFYSLRHPAIQRLFWRRLGPVIEWIMHTFLIGWARRGEERKT